jgi:hypothetical protein
VPAAPYQYNYTPYRLPFLGPYRIEGMSLLTTVVKKSIFCLKVLKLLKLHFLKHIYSTVTCTHDLSLAF